MVHSIESELMTTRPWLVLLGRKVDHGLEHTVRVGGREIEGGLALFEVKAVRDHDVHVKITTLHHVERRLYTVILTTYILDADFFVAQLVDEKGDPLSGRRDTDEEQLTARLEHFDGLVEGILFAAALEDHIEPAGLQRR